MITLQTISTTGDTYSGLLLYPRVEARPAGSTLVLAITGLAARATQLTGVTGGVVAESGGTLGAGLVVRAL